MFASRKNIRHGGRRKTNNFRKCKYCLDKKFISATVINIWCYACLSIQYIGVLCRIGCSHAAVEEPGDVSERRRDTTWAINPLWKELSSTGITREELSAKKAWLSWSGCSLCRFVFSSGMASTNAVRCSIIGYSDRYCRGCLNPVRGGNSLCNEWVGQVDQLPDMCNWYINAGFKKREGR